MPEPRGARRTVVIAPPPTPNGDLHVGHLAGPYLACDVYARYLRAVGRDVLYATGTDDSQTYVVATARRRGTTPQALAERSWTEIRDTLAATGMAVDGFAPFDDGYRRTVLDFVEALHEAGRFELRTVRFPYAERTGEYLMEGLVAGECPVCLAESRGGLCEGCGHPNNFDELIDPRSTVDPDEVLTTREATVLVLPMERYRDELTAYYRSSAVHLRPHTRQLVREALARPLPDFPITYPTPWGIPAPFAETPGQTVNAWVEGMPASMYCTAHAARESGEEPGGNDELWKTAHDVELVYFLGFDNVYFWGMTHLALLMAHGDRYIRPAAIVSNEFYELEHEKFSTSKGHVVWGRDLAAEVPRDLMRFYLALTAPEHQRTNFGRAALDKITAERLTGPWNDLAGRITKALADLGATGAEGARLPVSAEARRRAAAMVERFSHSYELAGFSLARAADLIVEHLGRLRGRSLALETTPAEQLPARLGDLLLESRTLVAAAAPILADLAAATLRDGVDGRLHAEAVDVAEIAPFPLPPLGNAPGLG
ncbi:class I tRNA ligase family protein [Kitasatospora sp. NPDC088134]|uniref:class I tRNA ligase family protein n=1 Tax=Kitasatospora sp. NPDC088134 TaxID=3364071 RepID=UPI0037FF8E6C